MDTKDEYEGFIDYYYFDYNILDSIISFWGNIDNTTHKTSFSLYLILHQFYDLRKICIPYSMAHIWDIINGTKKYEEKVNIVKDISKGWCVSEDKNNELIRVDKYDDVFEHFNDVYLSMKMDHEIRNSFNPIVESIFEKSILNDEYSKMTDPDFYKKIINIYNAKKVK